MPLIKCAVKAKLTFWLLRIDIRSHQTDNNLSRNLISPLTIICCGNGVCHSRERGDIGGLCFPQQILNSPAA